MPNNFRYDINGLRALAVLAVVLFHFHVPGFSGGFVGVDIFFVISGFLMTGIIVRGLESKQGFKLFDFYMARARRIIPALFILCVTFLVLGWAVSKTECNTVNELTRSHYRSMPSLVA